METIKGILKINLTPKAVGVSLGAKENREINLLDAINYWRTKSGLEVDFVLGNGEVAIEVKGTSRVEHKDLRPLMAFREEYAPGEVLLVCNERAARIHEGIRVLPWRNFLQDLWEGKII